MKLLLLFAYTPVLFFHIVRKLATVCLQMYYASVHILVSNPNNVRSIVWEVVDGTEVLAEYAVAAVHAELRRIAKGIPCDHPGNKYFSVVPGEIVRNHEKLGRPCATTMSAMRW